MTDLYAVTSPGWKVHILLPSNSLLALGSDGNPSYCGREPESGWDIPEDDEARQRIEDGDLCGTCLRETDEVMLYVTD